jgi:AraC family transcriptional regulator, exoenzyme S synthesis regulatory protein ExsA
MNETDIINLPEDQLSSKAQQSEEIIFYDYNAAGSSRGKSVLNKNAISLVISGEKTMHFADKTVYIKEDEFHFLSSGNCVASMQPLRNDAFRSILLFFDNKTLSDFFIKYDHLIRSLKTRGKHLGQHYVAFKKDRFVANYIVSLELLLKSRGKLSAAMKLLKFEELLLHLLETYPDKLLSFQTPKNVNADDFEIRKVMEVNVTNQLQLEELAFLCHTSLSTFKRRFIKLYGMPAGPEGMIYFFQEILKAGFPDLKVKILHQIAEGDYVTSRKEFHATHTGTFMGIPASDKKVVIEVIEIIKLRDGKYVEHWGISNLPDVVKTISAA